jgi:hypothetical protein
VLNQAQEKPATGLCRTSTVRDIAIDTLKILSYFFRPRCSLVSEETFDLVGVRHGKFQTLGASFELDTPRWGRGNCIATRNLLHVDHLRPVSLKMRNVENSRSRLLSCLLSHILDLANHAIDDVWLPVEPFQNLIAATRFIAATGRNGPGIWGDFSIGFLHQLPISLAHNTEIVVQILPYLNALSELPAPLKRYEPQIRFAVDALKWDNRVLMVVVATLQHAYEFHQWHRKHVAERNARDQFLAALGITPKSYRTAEPLLSPASARTRRIAKTLATVWPET